jgi:hypothetical protein
MMLLPLPPNIIPGVNVISLFTHVLNKLEFLPMVGLCSLVYYLWGRPVANPKVKHLKDASLGKALALLKNNRLG